MIAIVFGFTAKRSERNRFSNIIYRCHIFEGCHRRTLGNPGALKVLVLGVLLLLRRGLQWYIHLRRDMSLHRCDVFQCFFDQIMIQLYKGPLNKPEQGE